jgi:hypothetical protein
MGLSFTIVAGPRRRSHGHILLSQIRDSPDLKDQVPVLMSPRNRVAQFYPQALGSLFVPSYDSHGYGGGIRPRLHTGCSTRLYIRGVITVYEDRSDDLKSNVITVPFVRKQTRVLIKE